MSVWLIWLNTKEKDRKAWDGKRGHPESLNLLGIQAVAIKVVRFRQVTSLDLEFNFH